MRKNDLSGDVAALREGAPLPPVHPGEILLEEFIRPHGLTPIRTANRLGVPRTRIERLVAGVAPVTEDTALRLERLFGASAEFWLKLQADYDLVVAQRRMDPSINAIEPLAAQQVASDKYGFSSAEGLGREPHPASSPVTEQSPLHHIADVDWSPHYAAIGEFVVAFEKIATALRFQYACLMQINGLKTWALATNLLNIPTVGPDALALAFCAAVNQLCDAVDTRAKADRARRETQELTSLRNEIVHGEWLTGGNVVIIGDTAELPTRQGIKRKATRTGEKVTEQPTIAELRALSERCNAVAREVQEVFGEVLQAAFNDSKFAAEFPIVKGG